MLGEADRELEHVGKSPRAKLAQHQQPTVERARDDGRQESGAGNHVEVELAEAFDRRGGRRGALRADHDDLVALGVVDDRGQISARTVQVGLDDLKREPRRGRGIEGVAAALEHRHPDGRRQPVRRRDHSEGPAELGPGREARHRANPRAATLRPRV